MDFRGKSISFYLRTKHKYHKISAIDSCLAWITLNGWRMMVGEHKWVENNDLY